MNDSTSHYVGVDIGTSGVRALCIDSSRRVRATASVLFENISGKRNDPNTWKEAVYQVLTELLLSIPAQSIIAICIDGTSGTILAVDGKGVPVSDAKMYNDTCTDKAILSQIEENAPRTSAAHGASSGLAKAIELMRITSAVGVQHEADWIAFKLSGVPALSDENNALKTGYDPVQSEWPDWIDNTEMQRSHLPKVLRAGEAIGPALGELAKQLGLSTNTYIVAGTTDGCASFLATGAEKVGDGVTVLGSTLTIKLLSSEPIYAPEYGIYSHKIGNTWLAGGASNTGGRVLDHYFNREQLESLSLQLNTDQSAELDYYPLLGKGERFPINDSNLLPRLTPRPNSDALFLQGLLEGISGIEKLAYHRLQELGAPSLASIRTIGGGNANTAWTKIRSRTLTVPFLESLSNDAAMGAAVLAVRGSVEAGIEAS